MAIFLAGSRPPSAASRGLSSRSSDRISLPGLAEQQRHDSCREGSDAVDAVDRCTGGEDARRTSPAASAPRASSRGLCTLPQGPVSPEGGRPRSGRDRRGEAEGPASCSRPTLWSLRRSAAARPSQAQLTTRRGSTPAPSSRPTVRLSSTLLPTRRGPRMRRS